MKTQWKKEKLLVTSNFSFSHSVFYPFREFSAIFVKFEIVVCKLFQFASLKFDVWERVKEDLGKQCGKPAFSPFLTEFYTLSEREIAILTIFNMSSANAFNLVTSKMFLFDKGLKGVVYHLHHLP